VTAEFFRKPILNSPYTHPWRHWEMDESGQPTQRIAETRRKADFVTPIPKPKNRKASQAELGLEDELGLSTAAQQYDLKSIINQVRGAVDAWRKLPEGSWLVTPETARLLKHWRHHDFGGVRPFFCQVEAVETAIWLTEVAPVAARHLAHHRVHLEARGAPGPKRSCPSSQAQLASGVTINLRIEAKRRAKNGASASSSGWPGSNQAT